MELYSIAEFTDVYADAFVADNEGHILFISVWGHDTALQALLAKLTLPVRSGGVAALTLRHKGSVRRLYIRQDKQSLAKLTGRTAKDCLFYGLRYIVAMI